MTTFTESRHAAEFIMSEANGKRSRDNKTLVSGQNLQAGTVLEYENNSTSRVTAWTGNRDSAGIPDPLPAGILINDVDASSADTAATVLIRDAEVNYNLLTYPVQDGADAITGLAALNIIARS
jgi:hypothetical protein